LIYQSRFYLFILMKLFIISHIEILLKVYKNPPLTLTTIGIFSIFSYFMAKTIIVQKNYYEKYTP